MKKKDSIKKLFFFYFIYLLIFIQGYNLIFTSIGRYGIIHSNVIKIQVPNKKYLICL